MKIILLALLLASCSTQRAVECYNIKHKIVIVNGKEIVLMTCNLGN